MTPQNTVELQFFTSDNLSELELPFVADYIPAGAPAQIQNFIDETLDLNKTLIAHPRTTFLAKARGSSMQDAGISDGDILVVDKAIEPNNNNIAVCTINGEVTVKRLNKIDDKLFLIPANKAFKPIEINEHANFIIWGVVTYIIHKAK